MCECVCMHACVSVYATSCMLECLCGGQKNNPWELVLSFHPEVPGINLRLSGSLAKCLYLLRCLRLLFWHWLTSCFKILFSGKILKIKIPGFLEISSLLNLCQGMSEGRTSCSLPSRLFNLPRKHWVNWNQASAIQWYQLVCLLGSCLPACFELRRSGYLLGNKQPHFWLLVGLVMQFGVGLVRIFLPCSILAEFQQTLFAIWAWGEAVPNLSRRFSQVLSGHA